MWNFFSSSNKLRKETIFNDVISTQIFIDSLLLYTQFYFNHTKKFFSLPSLRLTAVSNEKCEICDLIEWVFACCLLSTTRRSFASFSRCELMRKVFSSSSSLSRLLIIPNSKFFLLMPGSFNVIFKLQI